LRLLIIGDIDNQYIVNFSVSLKNYDNTIDIDIINPFWNSKIKHPNIDPYKKIFAYPPLNPIIARVPKIRGLVNIRNLNKTINHINKYINEYDVVLLHGFWLTHCYIFSKLKTSNIFSVGAIWGSDFYKRQNENELFGAIDKCDLMVISTQEMVKDVLRVKHIEKNKIRNCLFGLAPLQFLFQLQNISRKESKIRLGFKEDDFNIICGYNGSTNCQHLKIISVLNSIKSELPKKTKVVLPITYGGSTEYKMEIKEALEITGLQNIVYEKYLSDEDIAHLRKATDLMIQIPLTDAFSGSMQEHLFAQNIVIAGSWLPYQSLKDKGVYYETIDSINDLKEKLLFVFKNLDEIKSQVIKSNTADKFKTSLWSECIKGWYDAISEYKSDKNAC